jgi:tetratricopeptide (TPR) repeat protein
MKKFSALIFASFFFCGCSTTGGIWGEKKIVERNIAEEYFSIATEYKELGKYEKAISYFEKVLDDEKSGRYAFYEIALCNVYLKNWDKAKDSFETLLQSDEKNSSLKKSLAYICAMQGDLVSAEKIYREILSETDDASAMKNLAGVLLAEKKIGDAKEIFSLLNEKFPDDESIYVLKEKIGSAENSSSENSAEKDC